LEEGGGFGAGELGAAQEGEEGAALIGGKWDEVSVHGKN
jgi:hypothetical protein